MGQTGWDLVLAVIMGIGLAAACGFRIFLPFFVLSLAVASGRVQVSSDMAWVGETPAILTLGIATTLEIGAYYIPWLDNLLDTIASPVAIIAGTLAAAAFITGMDPLFKWTLAAILGGGAAGAVQLTTVSARAVSTSFTGGLGNPVVSTMEWVGASITSLLALLLPLAALVAVTLVLAAGFILWLRRTRKPQPVAA